MASNPQSAFFTSVAILLVLVTLYFTTNALKRNYEINQLKLEEEIRQREQEREQQEMIREQLAENEQRRQADISARFKEHQHYCFDLQIFVAEFRDEEHFQKQLTRDQSNQSITMQQSNKTSRKKDLNKTQPTKKSNSTEPIIYLFVLVLLYLLLKAASDITQHYKEQAKGDKSKTRRCSLQVYAQMKNDRRSSRGTLYSNIFNYLRKRISS